MSNDALKIMTKYAAEQTANLGILTARTVAYVPIKCGFYEQAANAYAHFIPYEPGFARAPLVDIALEVAAEGQGCDESGKRLLLFETARRIIGLTEHDESIAALDGLILEDARIRGE